MKKLIALFLSLAMLVSLCACMPQGETQETDAFSAPMDDAAYVYQAAADATPLPGGSTFGGAGVGAGITVKPFFCA